MWLRGDGGVEEKKSACTGENMEEELRLERLGRGVRREWEERMVGEKQSSCRELDQSAHGEYRNNGPQL